MKLRTTILALAACLLALAPPAFAANTFGNSVRAYLVPAVNGNTTAMNALAAQADGVTTSVNNQDPGVPATARLTLSSQPTTGDTFAIGPDTYEFVTAAGSVTNDANIGIPIGADAATTQANTVKAINAAVTSATGLTKTDSSTPALRNGTAHVKADSVSTKIRVRTATKAGGTVVGANPSYVLAESITAAADVWDVGNVNMNTLGGRVASSAGIGLANFTVTTGMISYGTVPVCFPFTVTAVNWNIATSTGTRRAEGTDTVTIANGCVLLTLAGSSAPNIQDGDVVQIVATGTVGAP